MLLGQYQLTLGDQYALLVPAPFRELFSDGAYITRGFEQNLLIMGSRAFQEIYTRIAGLNLADPLARLLQRLLLGNASRLEMDEAGRMVIPHTLASFADLKKDVILVGQGDYLEAWEPAHWEKQSLDLLNTQANAGRFAQLDLALRRAYPS